jgi:starvation-inducible DNA-binding protein
MTHVLETPISWIAAPAALQQTLVELLDLALQGKQAHWNVEGPLFKPVHEGLDELVDQWRDWYDDVAERLAALGESPDGRPQTIARTSTVEPLPAGRLTDRVVLALVEARVAAVAAAVATRAAAISDDLASQDLLVEILRGLDEQRWMLKAQLG